MAAGVTLSPCPRRPVVHASLTECAGCAAAPRQRLPLQGRVRLQGRGRLQGHVRLQGRLRLPGRLPLQGVEAVCAAADAAIALTVDTLTVDTLTVAADSLCRLRCCAATRSICSEAGQSLASVQRRGRALALGSVVSRASQLPVKPASCPPSPPAARTVTADSLCRPHAAPPCDACRATASDGQVATPPCVPLLRLSHRVRAASINAVTAATTCTR